MLNDFRRFVSFMSNINFTAKSTADLLNGLQKMVAVFIMKPNISQSTKRTVPFFKDILKQRAGGGGSLVDGEEGKRTLEMPPEACLCVG